MEPQKVDKIPKMGRPQGSAKNFSSINNELWFPSVKFASATLGIPMEVLREAKAHGCPAFVGSRVACIELVKWIFSRKKSDEGPRLEWSKELAKWKAKREELKHQHESGEVVERAYVKTVIRKFVTGLRDTLKRKFVNEWPVRMAAKPAEEIAAFLDAEVEGVYDDMHGMIQALEKPE